jgi:hypothetical protein
MIGLQPEIDACVAGAESALLDIKPHADRWRGISAGARSSGSASCRA